MTRKTKARKAVDRAAKACDRAYDALAAISEYIPDTTIDRHLKWLRDLATYANYLETCKWPDRMD